MTDIQPPNPAPQQPAYAPQQGGPVYTGPSSPDPQLAAYGQPQQIPPTKQRNILGIIALVLAGLGFIFAVIPGWLILGWILLPISFVLGIIAVCLKGKVKWQGFAAIIVSVIGTIIGIVVFFALAATAVSDAFGGTEVEIGGDTNVSEETDGAEEPATAAGTRENPIAFGTQITSGDWEVTLTKFTPDANAQVNEWNEFNDKPAAGQVYVMVDMTAKYIGDDEGMSAMVQVEYVAADGTVISTWDNLVAGVDPQFGTATLLNGAADTGKQVYLVPSSLDGLIRVTPGVLTDEVYFKLP